MRRRDGKDERMRGGDGMGGGIPEQKHLWPQINVANVLVHKRQRHLYALISNATLILLITWAGTMAIDHMTEQYWDLGKLHVGIETYMPMSHIRQ